MTMTLDTHHSDISFVLNGWRTTVPVVAWTYDADTHCNDCAALRFGAMNLDRIISDGSTDWAAEYGAEMVEHMADNDGNSPHVVTADDVPGFLVASGAPVVACGSCRRLIGEITDAWREHCVELSGRPIVSAHPMDDTDDDAMRALAFDRFCAIYAREDVDARGAHFLAWEEAATEIGAQWRAADLAAERATYAADLLELAAA
jgi:hypothetical protein